MLNQRITQDLLCRLIKSFVQRQPPGRVDSALEATSTIHANSAGLQPSAPLPCVELILLRSTPVVPWIVTVSVLHGARDILFPRSCSLRMNTPPVLESNGLITTLKITASHRCTYADISSRQVHTLLLQLQQQRLYKDRLTPMKCPQNLQIPTTQTIIETVQARLQDATYVNRDSKFKQNIYRLTPLKCPQFFSNLSFLLLFRCPFFSFFFDHFDHFSIFPYHFFFCLSFIIFHLLFFIFFFFFFFFFHFSVVRADAKTGNIHFEKMNFLGLSGRGGGRGQSARLWSHFMQCEQ